MTLLLAMARNTRVDSSVDELLARVVLVLSVLLWDGMSPVKRLRACCSRRRSAG